MVKLRHGLKTFSRPYSKCQSQGSYSRLCDSTVLAVALCFSEVYVLAPRASESLNPDRGEKKGIRWLPQALHSGINVLELAVTLRSIKKEQH